MTMTMTMAISLLYRDSEAAAATPSAGSRTLYNLSLDRSFSYICPDTKKREYFLSVLSSLLTSPENIAYRRGILNDFLASPELFGKLSDLFSRFEELHISHKTAEKGGFAVSVGGNHSTESARNLCKTYALNLKRALLFIKAIAETLSSSAVKSPGLCRLKDELYSVCTSPDFEKMISHCAVFDSFSKSGALGFLLHVGADGCIDECELIEHKYVHVTDPDLKTKRSLFSRKKEEEKHPCARLYPSQNDFYESLTVGALLRISDMLRAFATQLFSRYCGIFKELDFYRVAMRYCEALKEKNITLIYPEIVTDGETELFELKDLYLLLSSPGAESVIPNDAKIKGGGLAVFGENGSGKTVFLRSLATAQILSQAGLPIPARMGTVRPYSGIVTQFSEAEREFVVGNDAGRFEEEVRELAEAVNTLSRGTLVFLNETFQSTSYDEGAACLYHILRYFSDKGISWVLVSHLRQLQPMFRDDGIPMLFTREKYKITE